MASRSACFAVSKGPLIRLLTAHTWRAAPPRGEGPQQGG